MTQIESPPITLFTCERYAARLTARGCALNYAHRELGRPRCNGCPIGPTNAHALPRDYAEPILVHCRNWWCIGKAPIVNGASGFCDRCRANVLLGPPGDFLRGDHPSTLDTPVPAALSEPLSVVDERQARRNYRDHLVRLQRHRERLRELELERVARVLRQAADNAQRELRRLQVPHVVERPPFIGPLPLWAVKIAKANSPQYVSTLSVSPGPLLRLRCPFCRGHAGIGYHAGSWNYGHRHPACVQWARSSPYEIGEGWGAGVWENPKLQLHFLARYEKLRADKLRTVEQMIRDYHLTPDDVRRLGEQFRQAWEQGLGDGPWI